MNLNGKSLSVNSRRVCKIAIVSLHRSNVIVQYSSDYKLKKQNTSGHQNLSRVFRGISLPPTCKFKMCLSAVLQPISLLSVVLTARLCLYARHPQTNISSGTQRSSIPTAPAAEPISRDTAWKPEKSQDCCD